jgi:hypothetical protein
MGDSFYHIFTTPYLFLLTLFFGRRGVGIHNVITKIYHMSVITLILRKICDNKYYSAFDVSQMDRKAVLGTLILTTDCSVYLITVRSSQWV